MAARAVRQECKHRNGEKKGGCVCCGRAELSRGCVGPPTFLWGTQGMAVALSPARSAASLSIFLGCSCVPASGAQCHKEGLTPY